MSHKNIVMQQLTQSLIFSLASYTLRQVFLQNLQWGVRERDVKNMTSTSWSERKGSKIRRKGQKEGLKRKDFRYDQEDMPPKNIVLYKHVPVVH